MQISNRLRKSRILEIHRHLKYDQVKSNLFYENSLDSCEFTIKIYMKMLDLDNLNLPLQNLWQVGINFLDVS